MIKSRYGLVLAVAVLATFLAATGPPAHAITADGNISDIRALIGSPGPGMPPAKELVDTGPGAGASGFGDNPLATGTIPSTTLCPGGGCQSPSGFNIGSIVLAYDPLNDAYYIGIDVSPSPALDLAFGNGSGAWDGDGDGAPNTLSDGLLLSPPVLYDIVPQNSGLTDKYTCSVDINNDGTFEFLVKVEDNGSGPVLAVSNPSLTVSGGWTTGDYAGNGPDVEFVVSGVKAQYGTGTAKNYPDCAFYTVKLFGFADTDADDAEENTTLVFNLDRPVTICKKDGQGAGVEGWVFTVDGQPIAPTDANGCVTIFAAPGSSLDICEQLPQLGLNALDNVTVNGSPETPDNPVPGQYCVNVHADDCPQVNFQNKCTSTITVKKLNLANCDADPATGTPVEGFKFRITGPGVDEELTTNAQGEASITVGEGAYTICETLPQGDDSTFCSVFVDDVEVANPTNPSPGVFCAEVTVACDELDESHTVTFYNSKPQCSISACKQDHDGNPIVGWTFLLLDSVGTQIDSGVTGEDGCVLFEDLAPGQYFVAEEVPQTVNGKTYNKVDGDVTVNDNCAQSSGSVTPTENPAGVWSVPVDLSGGCCPDDPDVTVTFSNTCEVEVTVCKLGLQSATCDLAATTNPVPGWSFILHYPDQSETVLTTGESGCTSAVKLEPGVYTIREELASGATFCQLEVNGTPVTPTIVGNVVSYEFTISCDDVSPIQFTFTNASGGPTRTPGYWFTHPAAMLAAFDCICTATPSRCDNGKIILCPTNSCKVSPNDAMAIFWRTQGGNRPTLAQHILSAMFNSCLLGTPAPGNIIQDGLDVLCDPNATNEEIGAVIGPLDDFNNSGDDIAADVLDQFSPANSALAKSMANAGTVPDCAIGKRVRNR